MSSESEPNTRDQKLNNFLGNFMQDLGYHEIEASCLEENAGSNLTDEQSSEIGYHRNEAQKLFQIITGIVGPKPE